MSINKSYTHYKAKCPFYKDEDPFHIRCEGTTSDNTINLTFGDKLCKRKYRDAYCCEFYNECVIAKGLFIKHEK